MHTLVHTNQDDAAMAIARGIDRALGSGLKVLWLLSGGSNIPVEVAALSILQHATPGTLTLGLVDERFVPLDSPDSNWHQLRVAGLNGEKATLLAPIINADDSLEATAADFGKRLMAAIKKADVIIGQFGVGPDGHTAGILPYSPGVHARRLVVGYEGPDFQRITTTAALFNKLSLAVVVAMGEPKKAPLERMNTDVSADDQPAQLLLRARDVIIYTDQPVAWRPQPAILHQEKR